MFSFILVMEVSQRALLSIMVELNAFALTIHYGSVVYKFIHEFLDSTSVHPSASVCTWGNQFLYFHLIC